MPTPSDTPPETDRFFEDEAGFEAEDLAAARSGDHAAFTRLVDAYIDRLYGFSRHMCSHPEDAEDTLQETLLTAWRRLADYRGEGPLRNWLFRIASSHCLKQRRRRVGEPERHLSVEELGPEALRPVKEGPSLSSIAAAPLEAILRDELRERIDAAIDQLPPEYRLVLLLRDVEGFSTAETAELTGLSEAAVKSRLHRARLEVRLALQPYLEEKVG